LNITKDIEVYHFFATGFYLYPLIQNLPHFYSGHTKFSPCVSKLNNNLSEEYLSPQKTQKAAVFFSRKNLGLRIFEILTNLKILKKFVHIISL
jgi:hypothetical protein